MTNKITIKLILGNGEVINSPKKLGTPLHILRKDIQNIKSHNWNDLRFLTKAENQSIGKSQEKNIMIKDVCSKDGSYYKIQMMTKKDLQDKEKNKYIAFIEQILKNSNNKTIKLNKLFELSKNIFGIEYTERKFGLTLEQLLSSIPSIFTINSFEVTLRNRKIEKVENTQLFLNNGKNVKQSNDFIS